MRTRSKRTSEFGVAVLAIAAAVAAVHAPDRVLALPAEPMQESVFRVPQIRCESQLTGDPAGPTGFGVLLSASLREPNAVGYYLDLARCHLTSSVGTRFAEAEETLGVALTRLRAERRARPAPPADLPATPLRVGGSVPPAAKLKDVPATYPADARASGIGGVVFVDAVIDPEGNVKDARVMGSIPALDAAAVAAVRQWKYAPTIVNGTPVEVVRLVTIKFATIPGSSPTDGVDVARFHEAQGHYPEADAALTQTIALVRELRQQSAAPKAASAVRVVSGATGEVRAPVKIFDVRPVYPKAASDKRVQGMVVIEATIAKEGAVKAARVVESVGGLDDAALAAVRQWRYTPATSDGIAVDVIMTVKVNFSLQ